MRSVGYIRSAKIFNIVMSAAYVVFGAIALAMPMTTMALGITAGVLMCALGISKLVGYFSKDLFRLAFQYDLELGITVAVLGITIAAVPTVTASLVCAVFGIVALICGIFRTTVAVESARFGIKPWLLILISAIITCMCGMLLIILTTVSVVAAKTMLGITFIADGISNLIVMLTTVKIIKHQQPDNIPD